jgi:hypothetical protein
MRPGDDRPIGLGCRVALLVVGLASWAAGGVAAFLSGDGAGTAALIITGALTSAAPAENPIRPSGSWHGQKW